MTLRSSILFLLSLVMTSVSASAASAASASAASASASASVSATSSSSSSSSRYTGHVATPTHPEDLQHRIPNEYNFCTSQQCTPTWNQYSPQYCGSCFIHAALSSISDRMIAVSDGKVNVMLARQDVLNCGAPHDLGGGCRGGEANDVFEYVYRYGIPDETCNTYRAEPSQQCDAKARCMTCTPPQSKHADPTSTCEAVKEYTTYHITSYGTLVGEAAMRAEIYARGPIVCGMALSDAFASWNGEGIYRENQTTWSEDDINHDIEVVGWGEENGQAYWVVKNSFGSFWGNEGYARLARGVNESLVVSTCDFPLLDRTTYRKQIQHGLDMFALTPVSFAAAAAVSSSEGQPSHHQPTQHSHHNPEATDPKSPTRGPEEEDEKPPSNHPSSDIAYDDSHNPIAASTVSLSSLDTPSTLSTSSILVLILSCLICISIFTILYCALHLRSFDLQTAWKRSIKQLTPTSAATSEERIPILNGEFTPQQQIYCIPHKFPTITIPAESGTPIHVLPAHTAASIATTITNTPSSPSPPSACSSTKSTPRTTPLKSCRRLSQTPSDKATLPKRVSWANFHKIGSHENLSQSAAIQAEMHRASCEDGKISPPLVITRPSYLTINVE